MLSRGLILLILTKSASVTLSLPASSSQLYAVVDNVKASYCSDRL